MNLEPIRALIAQWKGCIEAARSNEVSNTIESEARLQKAVRELYESGSAALPSLSQLLEAVTWIKCSERMPERGQWCLVIWKGYLQHEAYQFNGDWVPSHDDDDHVAPNDFSHWMPLPEPPEDK